MLTVNLETAKHVIEAVEAKARSIDCPVNIAVVDAGGNLVAHARMDNAPIGAIDIAINKAWTARAFDMETAELGRYSQPGGPFFGIHTSNGGRVMILAGGVPLRHANQVIGALGVSGGSDEQDSACARAGIEALAALIGATTALPAFAASAAESPFLAENNAAMRQMMTAMQIQPSGDADLDFVAMMVPHHQGAIDMAQAELRYGHNERLRRMAQEIVVTQQEEIAVMRLALGQPSTPSVASPTADHAAGTLMADHSTMHLEP